MSNLLHTDNPPDTSLIRGRAYTDNPYLSGKTRDISPSTPRPANPQRHVRAHLRRSATLTESSSSSGQPITTTSESNSQAKLLASTSAPHLVVSPPTH